MWYRLTYDLRAGGDPRITYRTAKFEEFEADDDESAKVKANEKWEEIKKKNPPREWDTTRYALDRIELLEQYDDPKEYKPPE